MIPCPHPKSTPKANLCRACYDAKRLQKTRRRCLNCGTEFKCRNPKNDTFCSRKCSGLWMWISSRKDERTQPSSPMSPIGCTFADCPNIFTPKSKTNRFCCNRCAWKHRNRTVYTTDKAAIQLKLKSWAQAHIDYVRHRARKYAWAHKQERADYQKVWALENEDKVRAYSHRRRVLKSQSTRLELALTKDEWEILCDLWGNKCAYCDMSAKLTQDHIIPLSKGGTHTLSNIAPACSSCNSRKGARPVEEFLVELRG